ncbi:ABC transporter ATP-binding protein [Streptomyces scabiei]|uniref:Zinc import ATP-binding protein ZnuC n=1 Tax=Streptomyces scabiei TaxID=1930 RepID=A0A100JLY0_STRSC|nr:ATP-binding cassette domain-containing protein [Streptomyces scabiei]GAQ61933.1 zinc import ATP-binding protein ZnuC [Streptomyces scabiei]
MERELLLRLEGVGRRYGFRGPWVLRDVDLEIAPGTLTRVEGANGTGKSTLLRVLAGLDAPTVGRATGRPRTAYVPERFPAALPFTAAEYLTHLGAVHGLDRPAAARAATEWLERFGAAEYARTPMGELSKGSSQKVAVAQALLAAPELLVLDEAWTGLDADAREELERVVVERTAAGAAVVFVDHDPGRLAGAPDAVYAVVGGALALREGNGTARTAADGTAVAAAVVVEGRGASGRQVPEQIGKLATRVEESGAGTHRFTVPAAASDALLRALLEARPPWHVVSVGPAPAPPTAPDPEPGPDPAARPDPTPEPDPAPEPALEGERA